MDRNNIEKIAHCAEDKVLLAKLWDKINAGMRKNILSSTCFLSPREQELARYLFGSPRVRIMEETAVVFPVPAYPFTTSMSSSSPQRKSAAVLKKLSWERVGSNFKLDMNPLYK